MPFKTGFPPNWISGLGDRNPQCCSNREAPAQTHLCTFCLDIRAHVISTVSVTFKAPHWFRKFSTEGCRWNCSWSGVLVPKLWCGLCDNCRQWKPLSVWSPVRLSLNKTCRLPLFILLCARNPHKVQGNLTPYDILPTKKPILDRWDSSTADILHQRTSGPALDGTGPAAPVVNAGFW